MGVERVEREAAGSGAMGTWTTMSRKRQIRKNL